MGDALAGARYASSIPLLGAIVAAVEVLALALRIATRRRFANPV